MNVLLYDLDLIYKHIIFQLRGFKDKFCQNLLYPQLELRIGKRVFTHHLHTLKDKPSRFNKRIKILSRFDVKIHWGNWLKPAILR